MNEPATILIDITFILLNLCVFLFNYTITEKKMYQPSVLFSLLWFFVVLLHFIFRFTILNELYPLSLNSYLVFLAGNICFSVGSLFVNIYNQTHNSKNQNTSIQYSAIKISLLLRILFMTIVVVGLPFYIQAAIKLFIQSESENFFKGLRYEMSYGDTGLGVLKYFLAFSFVVFAISFYAYVNEKNLVNLLIVIVTLLVTITYSVFSSGRSVFFIILTLYIGISFLYSKGSAIKKYAWLVLLFLPLFMVLGILTDKGGSKENSLKDNIQGSTEAVAIYIATPLNAFDLERKNFREPDYTGENTLRFFIIIGQQFGLFENRKVKELVQEFVFVPYPTNVYTYYSPYIKDFGLLYSLIIISLIGALHTWLCNMAVRKRTLRYSLYYSFLLYPLIMTYFTDQYFSLFSSWIQTVVYIELALFLNKYLSRIRFR